MTTDTKTEKKFNWSRLWHEVPMVTGYVDKGISGVLSGDPDKLISARGLWAIGLVTLSGLAVAGLPVMAAAGFGAAVVTMPILLAAAIVGGLGIGLLGLNIADACQEHYLNRRYRRSAVNLVEQHKAKRKNLPWFTSKIHKP